MGVEIRKERFDDVQAVTDLENVGTTPEGNATRIETGKSTAFIECQNYTKDRAEVKLDEDLASSSSDLQRKIAQDSAVALGLKERGSDQLKAGN